jgi:peptidoglycan/xylan/chitin deacetylase (PgdA/CDA1 family)
VGRALLGGLLVAAAVAAVSPAPLAAAGECSSGYVALTFDDGPSSAYTAPILDVLAGRGAIATFFVAGYRVEQFPQLVERAYAEGHAIANHAYSHKRLSSMGPDMVRAEITRTRDLVEALGVPMTPIVRPPYGAFNSSVKSVIESEGMTMVWATIDGGEYTGISAATLAGRVLRNLHPDANVILHDGINASRSTLAALPAILDGMAVRGYCTGVLDSTGAVVPLREPQQSDPPPACGLAEGCDEIGYVDVGGAWHLLDSATATAEAGFYFGDPGDVPFAGDWDCDGFDSAGVYRRATGRAYLATGRRGSGAVTTFVFGNPDDVPLVGDFDGDGCDTLGLYRPSTTTLYLSNTLGAAVAEIAFPYGDPGDVPFFGDFDGDGDDDLGLHRPAAGRIFLRYSVTAGTPDASFLYGEPGDVVVAGDFDGDGTDTVSAFRRPRNTWYLRLSNSAGPADHSIYFGDRRLQIVVGRFG